VGVRYPLEISMYPLGICKVSKKNMLISSLKKCNTLLIPHVVSVELPWLEKLIFKNVLIRKMFCSVLYSALSN